MNVWTSNRRAFGIAAVAALLAGCGGASPTAGISAAVPQTGAPARTPEGVAHAFAMTLASGLVPIRHLSRTSWFDAAKAKRLKGGGYLYVSDIFSVYDEEGAVEVYSYDPKTMASSEIGKPSFHDPYGSCSDEKGDVYVVDFYAFTISEFAFGGTTVTRKLDDDTGYPIGCSVDPTTGNLAVTNFYDLNGSGGVLIFKNASGTPTQYVGALYDWPAGYDPNGNLWVQGEEGACSSTCVMELAKGASAFRSVTFDKTVNFPGAVQWDGAYLDLLDQEYEGLDQVGLYQTKISGRRLTAVNTVIPTSTCDSDRTGFVQWASIAARPDDLPKTQATQIVAGNSYCTDSTPIWSFPAGGSPSGNISGPNYAIGQTYVTKPQ